MVCHVINHERDRALANFMGFVYPCTLLFIQTGDYSGRLSLPHLRQDELTDDDGMPLMVAVHTMKTRNKTPK